MSLEAAIPNPSNRHPSREEYKAKAVQDLEEQFSLMESAVPAGKFGHSKALFPFAYDTLLKLEKKGLLTPEQAASYHARAEAIDGQLYEEAA